MSHKVNLHLTAADQGTEIMLVDAFLGRVGSELGELRTTVAPGVYKARFISGGVMRDVLLDATRPGQDVAFHQEAMNLHSATPLPVAQQTTSSPIDVAAQMAFAEANSTVEDQRLGNGSHLFLLVRDEANIGPVAGVDKLEVLSMNGDKLATLSDGRHDPSIAAASLSLSVDPGNYRLRVNGGTAGTYEWTVSTIPGFQTQVFQRVERFATAKDDVLSPALRSASLLMVQGLGFQPHRPDMRLTEMALQALLRGRQILPERIIPQLLHYEQQNPMLGLLAAHMFVTEENGRRKHRRILTQILDFLLHVMPTQPDVIILQRLLARKRDQNIPALQDPPLLRSSWDMLTETTRPREHIIQPGSPAHQLAPFVIGSRPWLLFASPTGEHLKGNNSPKREANSIELLRDLMAKDPERWNIMVDRLKGSGRLNNLQMGLLRSLGSVNYLRDILKGSSTMSMPNTMERAKEFYDTINAPRSVKSNAIQDLAEILKDN